MARPFRYAWFRGRNRGRGTVGFPEMSAHANEAPPFIEKLPADAAPGTALWVYAGPEDPPKAPAPGAPGGTRPIACPISCAVMAATACE